MTTFMSALVFLVGQGTGDTGGQLSVRGQLFNVELIVRRVVA